MHHVSVFRLNVLRAMYLFIVLGLGFYLWPEMLHGHAHWSVSEGQASCMLGAFSIVCALGLRYPLQMLPVLLWEVLWKTLWLVMVPFAQWRAGHVDEALQPSIFACSMVVLVYAAIPWDYVWSQYVTGAAEPVRKPAAPVRGFQA